MEPAPTLPAAESSVATSSSIGQGEVIIQDDDVIMREISEESDGFIPLDPETIAEEKDLLETRLYNEFDLEGMVNPLILICLTRIEGVGFEDEELALDKKLATAQADRRRKEMEDAINEV